MFVFKKCFFNNLMVILTIFEPVFVTFIPSLVLYGISEIICKFSISKTLPNINQEFALIYFYIFI